MANRILDNALAVGGERTLVAGRVAIGATGAVGTQTGVGFSVSRDQAGVYTITLADTWDAILTGRAWLAQADAAQALYPKFERSSTGGTLRCLNNPWGGGAREPHPYSLIAPAAGGTNVHATFAGVHLLVTSAITQPDCPRNVQIDAAGAGDFSIIGVNVNGATITDTLTAGGAGVVVGVKAFAGFTSLSGTAGGTWQFAAAADTVFGLGTDTAAVHALYANGVKEAVAFNSTHFTFKPTTAPAGNTDYLLWYSSEETADADKTDPASGSELHVEFWCRNTDGA